MNPSLTNVPVRTPQVRRRLPASRLVRPSLEMLEQREVLTTVSFNPTTGVLTVMGDSSSEYAKVWVDTHNTATTQDDQVKVTLSGGQTSPVAPNLYKPDGSQNVKSIRFYGWGGWDYFENATSLVCSAWGGEGNDTLEGGSGNDLLVGDSGNDYLYGSQGNDILRGGWGHDRMWGEEGDDYLDDLVWEGEFPLEDGDDKLYGGSGKDVLYGRGGNDLLDGGVDYTADELWGGTGADQFRKDPFYYYPTKSYFNLDYAKDYKSGEGDTYYA